MKQVSIDELKQIAAAARESIWQQAKRLGRDPKIYLHWTAGHYNQLSDHYQICIKGNGEIWQMLPLDEPTSSTYKRNTGAVNISLCGCWDAGSQSLGSEPPTAKQIEAMAQVIAAIADGLWLSITKQWVLTHGEAAANEDNDSRWHMPYAWWHDSYGDGDTRGDLEYLGTAESPRYNPQATDGSRGGDVLRGKANYYRQYWKS
jgi:hypothetical protein